MIRPRTSLLLLAMAFPLVSEAGFEIEYDFAGGLSSSQEAIFEEAKATWESYLTGYQPGITQTKVTVPASGESIDGSGGILGSAEPSSLVKQGGFWLTRNGIMRFDSVDLDNMEDELMTGWIGSGDHSGFISNTTLESFQDIGFTVNMPIPEPGVVILSTGALICIEFRRRRPLSR